MQSSGLTVECGFMPGAISVHELQTSQLREASCIYRLAFPSSALTSLGSEVRQRYLAWLLDGPEALAAFGASCGGGLGGFCYVLSGDPVASFVGSHKGLLLRSTLKHPLALKRAGLARLARLLLPKPAPVATTPRVVVYLIAVHPSCQGRGIGSALLDACEAAARDRGVREMFLRVHPDNQRASRLYEETGWKKVMERGPWSGSMKKELSSD